MEFLNVPDNYDLFVEYEREQERYERLERKNEMEELEDEHFIQPY